MSSLRSLQISGKAVEMFDSIRIEIYDCPVCGSDLKIGVGDKNDCPKCSARTRIRAVVPVFNQLLQQGGDGGNVLAFAPPRTERAVLERFYSEICSVSLYGSYEGDHRSGIDARELINFKDDEFNAWYASLLFDYFPEHHEALAEAYRVLKPGGIFLTHIAAGRLLDNDYPPKITGPLRTKPGYFEGDWTGQIPSVRVGRDWFVMAIESAGFHVKRFVVEDRVSGECVEWFVGLSKKVPDSSIGT